jgi:hypothetical protein
MITKKEKAACREEGLARIASQRLIKLDSNRLMV